MNKTRTLLGIHKKKIDSPSEAIFRGITRSFDIGETSTNIHVLYRYFNDPACNTEAIRNDWQTVGSYLEGAMDAYGKEAKAKSKTL